MTERGYNHRFNALWVLAPVTAGVLGLSADWAIQHNPMESAEASVASPGTPTSATPRIRELEARLTNVTARYEARRQALIEVQRSLRQGSLRVAELRKANQSSRATVAAAPPAAAPAAPPAAVPQAPPAAPAPPAPPPVDTSTGAS